MKSSVVFCLAVSFAMFGCGLSLQCYSCPEGTSTKCEVKQQCVESDDSCLELTSGEMTYTACMRHADCNFMTLSFRYPVAKFTYSCCQSDLCNGPKKSFMEMIKDLFG